MTNIIHDMTIEVPIKSKKIITFNRTNLFKIDDSFIYLDDLLELSNKIERYKSALDIANQFIDYCVGMRNMVSAINVRKEITQALDKKD